MAIMFKHDFTDNCLGNISFRNNSIGNIVSMVKGLKVAVANCAIILTVMSFKFNKHFDMNVYFVNVNNLFFLVY